ncbi:HTH-type transcriptional repressor CzrA [compost metagenome]
MDRNSHSFLSDETTQNVSSIFKALADPTRLRILYLLSQEECSVSHISEVLSLSQSAISHQLSFLRNLRLVKFRRSANTLYYSCDDEHVISLLIQAIEHAECDHRKGGEHA